jgi:site-specific DNA recombinase
VKSIAPAKPLRCAIYTRKSTEQGLEQEFNSLDNQREAAEAYVKSQAHEGWRLLPEAYDDGGYSGGSLERPALQRLLSEVQAGRVEVIVVYKVDRLTRALSDFAKLVELFDALGVSFVSVTQAFNTTTSMGRLTLNVLLSFAQFEREVTAERIRDKIAASKKKGLRMGGPVPLGYKVREKKLVIDLAEAEQVQGIFARYLELGCLNTLAADLRERGVLTKVSPRRDGTSRGGIPFSKGPLANLLRNRTYIGEVIHEGQHDRGEHAPIVSPELFEAVQAALSAKAQADGAGRANRGSLLRGLLFDDRGNGMTPSSVKKGALRYCYYVSRALEEGRRGEAGSVARVPAPEIEQAVLSAISRGEAGEVTGADAVTLAERVSRVVVQPGSLAIHLVAEQEESGDKPILLPWSAQAGRHRREVIPTGDESETVSAMRSETRAAVGTGSTTTAIRSSDSGLS